MALSIQETMKGLQSILLLIFLLSVLRSSSSASYDYSAYTECKSEPENPLYNGGIIDDQALSIKQSTNDKSGPSNRHSTVFVLHNLTGSTIYSFSSWVKISGVDSAVITANLTLYNTTHECIGNVIAKQDCWSFLKGGFVLDFPANYAQIEFKTSEEKEINKTIASTSLQPFTHHEWQTNQADKINAVRKRAAMIHVSDMRGERLQGATITIEQTSKDFPFGSAISKTILGNSRYQEWFVERFNAAVFENELKWYATEPEQGQVNYTVPDQMLEFIRAHQITVRGHNIFWEDPTYTPAWVRNLTGSELKQAVQSRIQSLTTHYISEFVHWDVSNEMLHFDFYEEKLGPNATLEFFKIVHKSDPLATLFMNDFNVVETCDDANSTVDAYISRLKDLEQGGVYADGIGLEGHFIVPNPPLIRATLDKLATLELPIWLTELDISNKLDKETQGKYLEAVLREFFSYPAVNGIVLWTALDSNGCYQMCLTDNNFKNLPAGDVVDKLLKEGQTGHVEGQTDDHGSFTFDGFLGEYMVTVSYENRTANSTFSLCQSEETRHFNIQL